MAENNLNDLTQRLELREDFVQLKAENLTLSNDIDAVETNLGKTIADDIADILERQSKLGVSGIQKTQAELANLSKLIADNASTLGSDAEILSKAIDRNKEVTRFANSRVSGAIDTAVDIAGKYAVDATAIATGILEDSPMLMFATKWIGDTAQNFLEKRAEEKKKAEDKQAQKIAAARRDALLEEQKALALQEKIRLLKEHGFTEDQIIQAQQASDREEALKKQQDALEDALAEFGLERVPSEETNENVPEREYQEQREPERVRTEPISPSNPLETVANELSESTMDADSRSAEAEQVAERNFEKQRENNRELERIREEQHSEKMDVLNRIAEALGNGSGKEGEEGDGGGLGSLFGAGKILGGLAAGLRALATGFAAFANPATAIGIAVFAGAILAVGAAIGGAIWLIGKSLPTMAEGIKAFEVLDGEQLEKVGSGVQALGLGILALGSGGIAGAFSNIANGILGLFGLDFDPLEKLKEMAEAAGNGDFDGFKNITPEMADGIEALAAGMTAISEAGASFGDGLANLITGESPEKALQRLAEAARVVGSGELDGLTRVPPGLAQGATELANAVTVFSNSGMGFFDGLANWVTGESPEKGIKRLGEAAEIVGTGILDGMTKVPQGLAAGATELANAITVFANSGTGFFDGLANWVTGNDPIEGLEKLGDVSEFLKENDLGGFVNVPEGLQQGVEILSAAITAFANSGTGFFDGIANWITGNDPIEGLAKIGEVSDYLKTNNLSGFSNLTQDIVSGSSVFANSIGFIDDVLDELEEFVDYDQEDLRYGLDNIKMISDSIISGALAGFSLIEEGADEKVEILGDIIDELNDLDEIDNEDAFESFKYALPIIQSLKNFAVDPFEVDPKIFFQQVADVIPRLEYISNTELGDPENTKNFVDQFKELSNLVPILNSFAEITDYTKIMDGLSLTMAAAKIISNFEASKGTSILGSIKRARLSIMETLGFETDEPEPMTLDQQLRQSFPERVPNFKQVDFHQTYEKGQFEQIRDVFGEIVPEQELATQQFMNEFFEKHPEIANNEVNANKLKGLISIDDNVNQYVIFMGGRERGTTPSGSGQRESYNPGVSNGNIVANEFDTGEPQLQDQQPSATGEAYMPSMDTEAPSGDIIDYIKQKEGFSETAYWDHQQWSIGHGTRADGPNATITPEEAQAELEANVSRFRNSVIEFAEENGYDWNENQIDAMTSFTYNGGTGWLDQVTAGGTRSNDEIQAKMLEYNRASGEQVPALVQRRREEAALFGRPMLEETPTEQQVALVPPTQGQVSLQGEVIDNVTTSTNDLQREQMALAAAAPTNNTAVVNAPSSSSTVVNVRRELKNDKGTFSLNNRLNSAWG